MLKSFVHIALFAIGGLWASQSYAQITNDVFVNGTFGTTAVEAMDEASVDVVLAEPSVQLTKIIDDVIDTNNSGRIDAGDTVIYRFEILNSGNQTLDQITLTDPPVTFTTTTIGPLLPLQSDATLTASYVLTQSNIDAGGFENSAQAEGTTPPNQDGSMQDSVLDVSDAGDELVETPALDGTTDDDPTNDPTVLTIDQVIELDIAKSLVATTQPFPFVFDLTYQIAIQNKGTVTANNIVLTDDLAAQFSPKTVLNASVANPTGAIVASDLNFDFDGGLTDASVLMPTLSLAPADAFTVEIIVRVEIPPATFVDGSATLENAASLENDESPDPFASFFDGEEGPVPVTFVDSDLDGVLDDEEALTPDRDGDGIENLLDLDPTGYLYCEEDGTVLTGGMISIAAITGDPNAIRVVLDGSTGAYQWYVTAPGTYEMSYTPPPSALESINRLPAGALSLTSLGGNYASLGSNEDGTSGILADFSETANPYHLIFEIAEGDPHVLNNNIPFRFCGTPLLSAVKDILQEPTQSGDGRTALSYSLTVANIGDSRAVDIGIEDPLDTVFGAGLYEIVSLDIIAAPTNFAATENPDYDGATDTALLTSGGQLDAGEEVTIQLALIVDPAETDVYINIMTASGARALGGAALDPQDASASVLLFQTALLSLSDLENQLLVTKSADPENVRVGDVVTYTIEVENNAAVALSGLSLVDQLPTGIRYRAGTALLDGIGDEPIRGGQKLTWDNFAISSGQTRVLSLQSIVGPQAGPGDIVNQAWVANGATGERITKIGRATVRIALEPVFDCSAVIGKVFDDRNLNGYQDLPPNQQDSITDQTYNGGKGERAILERQQELGEPGLPNVNVLTPTGTVITTDAFGRFSVPCAEVPKATGTNFSLKIDERTLPTGYHVVTENPRTMRLTAGIFAELNFGAALGDVITIKLTSDAFDVAGQPVPAFAASLQQLRAQVGDTYTLIDLSYYYRAEGAAEARRRLDSVEALFDSVWQGSGRNSLEIERTVYAAQ